MPTASLLLLALAGGYLFVHRFNGTRWRVAFYKWDRALLLSSMWGLGFFALLRFIPVACEMAQRAQILEPLDSWITSASVWLLLGVDLAREVTSRSHVPLFATFLGVAFLGALLPVILNRLPWFDRETHYLRAIEALGGRFTRLFVDAQVESVATGMDVLVEVTLQSRKVYVGVVLELPNVESEDEDLFLLPFLSGYRDKDTLEVEWTTDYVPAYAELEQGPLAERILEFAVVVPYREMVSARRFDLDFHERFFAPEESAEAGTPPSQGKSRNPGCAGAVVALLFTVCAFGTTPAVAPPSPARFAAELRAFGSPDSIARAERRPIVFYGSSSIRMWHDRLAADFAPLTVVGRGFGGSTMSEAAYHVDRLVAPLRPWAVVLYEGDNDIEMGRTPGEVVRDFDLLVAKLRSKLPQVQVFVLSLKPSGARWTKWPAMQETNTRLAAAARRSRGWMTFVDVGRPLLGSDGRPRPEMYLADRLHLTSAGYDAWREVVRPVLLAAETRRPATTSTKRVIRADSTASTP